MKPADRAKVNGGAKQKAPSNPFKELG